MTTPPGPISLNTDAMNPDDGRFNLFWNPSQYAQRYFLHENGIKIMEFPADLTQHHLDRPMGSYTYKIEAWNVAGSTFSNEITVYVGNTTNPNPFQIWAEEAGNPDTDGSFRLQWSSIMNVQWYRLHQNGVMIMETLTFDVPIHVNSSGNFSYFVEAKLQDGTIIRSNDLVVVVQLDLSSNSSNSPNSNETSDIADIIMKFLNENGLTVGLGAGVAAILGVVIQALKKGKFKIKIPTNLSCGSAPANVDIDDFLDGNL